MRPGGHRLTGRRLFLVDTAATAMTLPLESARAECEKILEGEWEFSRGQTPAKSRFSRFAGESDGGKSGDGAKGTGHGGHRWFHTPPHRVARALVSRAHGPHSE